MSRNWDKVDDIINATPVALGTGDWTIPAWIWPISVGEGANGRIIVMEDGVTNRQWFFTNGTAQIAGQVDCATVDANSTSAFNAIVLSVWNCVVCTFRASDKKIRLYRGAIDTPMAECSYANQDAGTGANPATGTNARIGNRNALDRTFDGRIARLALDAREWSLAEMEEYRLGRPPIQTGSLRAYWPLDSPTASQAEDLSGNAEHGTVTGCTVADDPPLGSPVGVMAIL